MSFYINNMLDNYLQPIFPTPINPTASSISANGVANSIWNITGITSRVRIAIPASDVNYRTGTTYSIGVTAALPQTEYMISAYPINSSPLFEGGLPIYDIITSAGKYNAVFLNHIFLYSSPCYHEETLHSNPHIFDRHLCILLLSEYTQTLLQ